MNIYFTIRLFVNKKKRVETNEFSVSRACTQWDIENAER